MREFAKIYAERKDEIAVIFLCLPNNPLGECPDVSEVYEFLELVSDDTMVVFDCAYNEFAKFKDAKKGVNPNELIAKFKNAVYLGTFSKAYGLGGMRVGYGIAGEDIIKELGKLRAPFNITTLSLVAAIEALKDENFVRKTLENNLEQMARYENFARESGIEFIPSYTNFITFKFMDKSASSIAQSMLKKGIILRDLKSYGLNAFRVTVGQARQNDRVFEELREILK